MIIAPAINTKFFITNSPTMLKNGKWLTNAWGEKSTPSVATSKCPIITHALRIAARGMRIPTPRTISITAKRRNKAKLLAIKGYAFAITSTTGLTPKSFRSPNQRKINARE